MLAELDVFHVRFVAELEDSAEFVLAAVKRPQAGGSAAPYLARAKSGASLRQR